jgi:hypothetical protein
MNEASMDNGTPMDAAEAAVIMQEAGDRTGPYLAWAAGYSSWRRPAVSRARRASGGLTRWRQDWRTC